MDAQSLSGVYKSNLQYEQLTSTSFVPVMIEHYFDPAADAVHVAVVADRWGGICREIAEHVYAEYERKPVPPPIQSDYMHGVSAMIIGLRAKVGAHDILAKLQQLRALCKETMSSEQAALQNKTKLYIEVRGLCKFARTAVRKEKESVPVPRHDYHHQFASPRQRSQMEETYNQLVREDEVSNTGQATPKRSLVEAQPEAIKKPKWMSPMAHFGSSLVLPKQHNRSNSAVAAMTSTQNTLATPVTPHRTIVGYSKQTTLPAASPAQPSPRIDIITEADVPFDNAVVVVPSGNSAHLEAMVSEAMQEKITPDEARSEEAVSNQAMLGENMPGKAMLDEAALEKDTPDEDMPEEAVPTEVESEMVPTKDDETQPLTPEEAEPKKVPTKDEATQPPTPTRDAPKAVSPSPSPSPNPTPPSTTSTASGRARGRGRGGGGRKAAEGKARAERGAIGKDVVKVGVRASEGRGAARGKGRVADRIARTLDRGRGGGSGRGGGRGRGRQQASTKK